MFKKTISRLIEALGYRVTYKIHPFVKEWDCYITINKLLNHFDPKTIYDIGANSGDWSNTLCRFSNNLQEIILFEPQQKCIEAIEKKEFKGLKTQIFKIGLGSVEGEFQLKGGSHSASVLDFDNSFKDTLNPELSDTQETIKVEKLDEVFTKYNLPIPDLIKIDVQGFEKEVISGGWETISKSKILILEISILPFYKNQPSSWDIISFLEQNDFVLIDIGYEWRENYSKNGKLLQFDAIFENKKI